jgi:hypothetical protein
MKAELLSYMGDDLMFVNNGAYQEVRVEELF